MIETNCAGNTPVRGFPETNDVSVGPEFFSVSWERTTAFGGEYRLCWCPATSECFLVYFGQLLVVGPTPIERTCVSGLSCSFAIEGELLKNGDSIGLSDECGKP